MKKELWIILVVIFILIGVGIIIGINVFESNDIKDNKVNNDDNKSGDSEVYYETLEDGSKVNTSEYIKEHEFILGDIKLSNIKVTEKDGYTNLEIDYENISKTDVEGFGVKFNFYNSKDELVYYYSVKLPEVIKAEEKSKINSSIFEEYVGIAYIKAEIDSEI